jgi:hypothetical protein
MSIELAGPHTDPHIKAKTTRPEVVWIYTPQSGPDGVDVNISIEDFCELVMYVLTNTDLTGEDDPRLLLLKRINRLYRAPGFNTAISPSSQSERLTNEGI